MSFSVYFNLFSENRFRRSDEARQAEDLSEAIGLVESLKLQEDILCVYLEESGYKAEVIVEEGGYLFQLFLMNGFYKINCSKMIVIDLLRNIENVCKCPEDFELIASEY